MNMFVIGGIAIAALLVFRFFPQLKAAMNSSGTPTSADGNGSLITGDLNIKRISELIASLAPIKAAKLVSGDIESTIHIANVMRIRRHLGANSETDAACSTIIQALSMPQAPLAPPTDTTTVPVV